MVFFVAIAIFALGFCLGRLSVDKQSGSQVSAPTSTNVVKPTEEAISKPLAEPAPVAEAPGDPSLFSYIHCTYEETDGIEITGYIGFDDSKIVIPDAIENLPVLSIGEKAFQNNNICEVVLPNSIIKICSKAFSKCRRLKNINFPPAMKSISEFAFAETSSLRNVTLPEGLTQLGNGAFWSSGISEISFPSTLEEIPSMCCEDCYSLHRVDISDGIKNIGSSAFAISQQLCSHRGYKNHLQYVIIPKSVEHIAFYAFNDRDGVNLDISTALVFMGMHTEIHKEITGKNRIHPEKTIAYVLAGSEAQKASRLKGFTVRPLSEFHNN